MKVAPLIRQMKSLPDAFRPVLIHTGQHYDEKMSRIFFHDLGLPPPDINLEVGSDSHAVQTAKIMERFEPLALSEKPDLVVVVGDVNSTLACSLVASKLHIPIAHIEAGLRSFDQSMPEEINRKLTDQISDYLFITSPEAQDNLMQEGISKDKIHFTGNIMIESLIQISEKAKSSSILDEKQLKKGEYGLLTLHRPSNVDCEDSLKKIISAIQKIGKKIPIVFPAHPRTKKQLAQFGISSNGLLISDPLGYLDFIALEMHARLVLTDSGGLQEETTYFHVPCLTIRENTERPITISEGTNVLVGTHPEKILTEAQKILNGQFKKGIVPQYWDDQVSSRIVKILMEP